MPNQSSPQYRLFKENQVVARPEVDDVFLKSQTQKGIFVLEGDRGAGKTTALLHLFTKYEKETRFQPFFIGLFPYAAPELAQKDNLYINAEEEMSADKIAEILKKITKYLHIKLDETADGSDPEYLSRQLAQRSNKKTPVLLVDSIYECETQTRQQLVRSILIPLLVSGEVILILSGRGKRPAWTYPAFRSAEIISLQSFSFEDVKNQLKLMGSAHSEDKEVEKIAQWSGGCPLVVRILGQSPQINERALDQAIRVLIRDGLKSEYRHDVEVLRPYIEKIALIQPFREIEVDTYLFGTQDEKRSRTKDFVYKLLSSNLLVWENSGARQGHALNGTITHTIRAWVIVPENLEKYRKYRGEWSVAVDALVALYPSAKKQEYEGMFLNLGDKE